MEGSDLTFESKISGTPIPKITWFKDEREIIPGNFMQIEMLLLYLSPISFEQIYDVCRCMIVFIEI